MMRKSFFIETTAVFGKPLPDEQAAGLFPSLPFSDGDTVYYQKERKSCIAQDFKGRLGYLQQFDFVFDEVVNLPVTVKQADLYVVYLMQASDSIQIADTQNAPITSLNKRRARFIYLPRGHYCLHVPPGTYQLFICYFDVGIFDSGADTGFEFLHPLLEAHREQSSRPMVSRDFMIGPVTEIYIQSLCEKLEKADVDSQIAIIFQLKEMIKLAKRKIDRELGVVTENEAMVETAKTLIELGVDEKGINYSLSTLTGLLPISEANLQVLFKKHFDITPNNFKKNYIIEKSKKMLTAGDTVLHIADELGFAHERSFYRLFKRCTGYSPKTYLSMLDSNSYL
ncbi:helix-turn-helix domain-containing protein [Sphingobacterium chuzhouense]|uniref:Helix-turn-helix transcriptional regulator n=1 Tax=Sphingobacterium chuzhouense TaxID=1742264 RepID=A0ABR7XPW9_9SPHI|nr:helix-turn-helix transcriptional regulator [Sphingobacterium chuzhouense]MBD1421229.1 helix-turn-helix transcriptional regulator [Sphingobacterium chuzhouense]